LTGNDIILLPKNVYFEIGFEKYMISVGCIDHN